MIHDDLPRPSFVSGLRRRQLNALGLGLQSLRDMTCCLLLNRAELGHAKAALRLLALVDDIPYLPNSAASQPKLLRWIYAFVSQGIARMPWWSCGHRSAFWFLLCFTSCSAGKKNQAFWIAYPQLELFWLRFVLAMSVTCHFSPLLYPQIKAKGDEYDSVQSFQFYLK